MSSFTGLSIITNGEQFTMFPVYEDTGRDSGYHLLVVNDYWRTIDAIPNGEDTRSGSFMVGGHQWYISYYPNGHEDSCDDFITLDLCLNDINIEETVEAKFQFSFVGQVEKQMPKEIFATETYRFSRDNPSCGPVKFMRIDALAQTEHVKADCFIIRCDIMLCKDLNTDDADGTRSEVHQQFDYLLQSKVGADVTFEVSGETFAAHRCVLAARSKVFMAQLFGPMKEGTTSSAIEIKDMRPKVFSALLKFIYTDSFPKMDKDDYIEKEEGLKLEEGQKSEDKQEVEQDQDEEEGHEEDVIWLTWLQDLLVASDRYDLQRLKSLCAKQLSEHIGLCSVASTLILAEQHHCQGLKEVCFKFIQVLSPKYLDQLMATDGWEHMSTTYPSILKELIAKLVSNQKKGIKRQHRWT